MINYIYFLVKMGYNHYLLELDENLVEKIEGTFTEVGATDTLLKGKQLPSDLREQHRFIDKNLVYVNTNEDYLQYSNVMGECFSKRFEEAVAENPVLNNGNFLVAETLNIFPREEDFKDHFGPVINTLKEICNIGNKDIKSGVLDVGLIPEQSSSYRAKVNGDDFIYNWFNELLD